MDDVGLAELFAQRGEEHVEHADAIFHHRHDRPRRHRDPVGVAEQLGDPFDRDVLAHHQIADQRPQVRPVADLAGRLGRERGGRLGPAPAAATLRPMLGDRRRDSWQVEHLAADLTGDRCVGETLPTSAAPLGGVAGDDVRVGDRSEVLAGGARLLARLLPERPRRDFGAGFVSPSDDGGLEELVEFIPSRALSCATSNTRLSISTACAATIARNPAISSINTVFCASSPSPTPTVYTLARRYVVDIRANRAIPAKS